MMTLRLSILVGLGYRCKHSESPSRCQFEKCIKIGNYQWSSKTLYKLTRLGPITMATDDTLEINQELQTKTGHGPGASFPGQGCCINPIEGPLPKGSGQRIRLWFERGMPLKNKNRAAGGVITIHTPTPLNLKPRVTAVAWADVPVSVPESRRSPYCRSVMTRNASPGRGRGGGGGREGGKTNQIWVPRSPRGPCVDWLSHSSFRRLQAKLESENQETGKIIQPLLDTEKGFIKDLERFLSHQEVLALRKKELLHRHWTERVWTPIQRTVEDRVTNCWSEEADRVRSMFMHYINHCNNKGFVSLEDYDPLEYNPLLQNINKPQFFKVTTRALRDPLFFQSRERVEEKRALLRCQTGHLYTRRKVEKLMKQSLPPQTVPNGWTSEMCPRSAVLPLLASPTHQGSTSRAPLVEVDPELWKLSRTSVTPYQLIATPDRRCLQAGCWSSRG